MKRTLWIAFAAFVAGLIVGSCETVTAPPPPCGPNGPQPCAPPHQSSLFSEILP